LIPDFYPLKFLLNMALRSPPPQDGCPWQTQRLSVQMEFFLHYMPYMLFTDLQKLSSPAARNREFSPEHMAWRHGEHRDFPDTAIQARSCKQNFQRTCIN